MTRGALWARGFDSRVVAPEGILPATRQGGSGLPWFGAFVGASLDAGETGPLVAFPGGGCSFSQLRSLRTVYSSHPLILAGHSLTADCRTKGAIVQAGPNEAIVLGEPYRTISGLVAPESEQLKFSLGAVQVGELLDPGDFRPPPPNGVEFSEGGAVPLFTSLGCVKKCGYCAHGESYAQHYGVHGVRRARPWPDLLEEMTTQIEAGNKRFHLLADQFLTADPMGNREISELTAQWTKAASSSGLPGFGAGAGLVRPELIFTIAPRELLANRALLCRMAEVFTLHPRLSVESLDNSTLEALSLDFTAAQALRAIRFLASMKISFRLNYIFLRPGMTVARVKEELAALVSIAGYTEHLTCYEQLLLTHDIFSRRLDILPGSPLALATVIPEDYEKNLPEAVFHIWSSAVTTIATLVGKATGSPSRPGLPAREVRGPNPIRVVVEASLKAAH